MISWPGTTHRGPPPPRDHWQGRAVCRDLFPWSIKSAPPVIPFDIPLTGMVKIAELARPYQNTNFGVDFFFNDNYDWNFFKHKCQICFLLQVQGCRH